MRDILSDTVAVEGAPDPAGQAQKQMKNRLPRRFYNDVSTAQAEGGFTVMLDGHKVVTPARRTLTLPNEELAKLVADEFRLQDVLIDPAKMPVTRLANTVVDAIGDDAQPVLEDILRFAAADMLFYRAESPRELARRQSEQWDRVLDWAANDMAAHFLTGQGVMHIEQPQQAITAVSHYLRRFPSPFALAALHAMTSLTGSALIALCIAAGEIDVATGWKLAHLDEDWTIEQWGEDDEGAMRRRRREDEMRAAAAVLAAS